MDNVKRERSMWYKLDENKQPIPITLDQLVTEGDYLWGKNKIVKQENIQVADKDYKVSTVFLGLDHNYGDGPPVLWETMIFSDDENLGEYQERYTSYADALKRHIEIADSLTLGITDPEKFGPQTNKPAKKSRFKFTFKKKSL